MELQAQSLLRSVFGFDEYRGRQQEVIEHLCHGGDALVLMPTGGGKSLCFQLPALVRDGTALVVSPLIALMQDQVQSLREYGIKAAFLNSTLLPAEASRVVRELRAGDIDLLYVSPERAVRPDFLDLLEEVPLSLIAIDEAHCVSMWGHDFRPEYAQLAVFGERFAGVPRIALTATADVPTRKDIRANLGLIGAREFVSSFDRPNIRYRVSLKREPRSQLLEFLRETHPREAGIIYCISRKKVEEIASFLRERGFDALPYHAGLSDEVRGANQHRFIYEEGVIMVATVAFGMGIDKPNVRFVVHMDLPKNIEAYYQETGRAGRDGLPSTAYMLYGLQDIVLLRQMIEEGGAGDERKRVEVQKLNALLGYAETASCRRQVLMEYFGETHPGSCGNCDSCLVPVATWDGTKEARQALSSVYRTGQRFGVAYLTDVLRGVDNERIVSFGHHTLPLFGIGAARSKAEWTSIFRQLTAAGYLAVDIGGYGGLHLTPKSGPLLKGEETIQFRTDPLLPKGGSKKAKKESADEAMGPQARQLFEALRKCRQELARKGNVPPYVIFHDSTLREIAVRRPENEAELRRISGVGDSKLQRYGADVLRVVREAGPSLRSG